MEIFKNIERVMVVTPHPDDAELGCGGTVAKLTNDGKEVIYVVATSGDRGGRDTDMSQEYLNDKRREEQEEAASILGVKHLVHLGFSDGNLEDDHPFRSALVYNIRLYKPNILFTTDPFRKSFYIHRDHRIAGLVSLDAVFPYARDRLHYPEHIEQGLAGHNVEEIYFWGSEEPDIFIDISDTVEQKANAVMAHRSQVQDWVDRAGGREKFIEKMKEVQPDDFLKEGFRCYGMKKMMKVYEEL